MRSFATCLLLALSAYLLSSCSPDSSPSVSEPILQDGNASLPPPTPKVTLPGSVDLGDESAYAQIESNYTMESLASSDIVTYDYGAWEKFVEFNEEGQGSDSRTGELIEGTYKVLGQDGNLSGVYNFKNGHPHGIWEEYHPSGVLSISSTYLQGKRHGKVQWQTEEGRKTYEANFIGGRMDGKELIWDENGAVISEITYRSGKIDEAEPSDEPLEDIGLDLDSPSQDLELEPTED